MENSRKKPLKELSRALRLKFYHWRNGPGFDYHGCHIELPDHIPFAFKRQLMQGVYEEAERELIEKFLDPQLPVIELGGSLGVVSAFVGSRLAADTPYRIVEANPVVLPILERNANSTRKGRKSEIIHRAVAYGKETVSFAVSENVHISRVGGNNPSRTVEIKTTTLAGEVAALGADMRYTLIMDVEGSEWDVLQFDRAAFACCDLAIIEFHPPVFADAGNSTEGFMAMVRAAGMEIVAQTQNTIACRPARG